MLGELGRELAPWALPAKWLQRGMRAAQTVKRGRAIWDKYRGTGDSGTEQQAPRAPAPAPAPPAQSAGATAGPSARNRPTGNHFERLTNAVLLLAARMVPQRIREGLARVKGTIQRGAGVVRRDLRQLGQDIAWSRPGKATIGRARQLSRTRAGRAVTAGIQRTKSGISRVGAGISKMAGSLGIRAGATAAVGAGGGGAAAGGAAVAGAAGAAAGLSALVPPLAALLVVVGAVVVGFAMLSRALKKQADELEEFSGAITGARAVNEQREVQNKIERAQAIGPQLAQIEAAKGRRDDALYDLGTEIYKTLATLAPVFETINDVITFIARTIETRINTAQATAAAVREAATGQWEFKETRREIAEAQESSAKAAKAFADIFRENDVVGDDDAVKWLLNHDPLAGMAAEPRANPAPPRKAGGRDFEVILVK